MCLFVLNFFKLNRIVVGVFFGIFCMRIRGKLLLATAVVSLGQILEGVICCLDIADKCHQ